jgi:hypothetical protein
MPPDFYAAVRATIEYQKRGEPDFVEGEQVVLIVNAVARGSDNRETRIPAGTRGVITIDWYEAIGALEAKCFFVTALFNGCKLGVREDWPTYLKSVDPVWSKPPVMPYSLGGSNYGRKI